MTEPTGPIKTKYVDLLNIICDMQVASNLAYRRETLIEIEKTIVFLEEEVNRLTKENARLSGKQKPHPALVSTEFIPDEDTRRNDAAFEASRKTWPPKVTPAMIAALDRNLVGQVAQSREQLLGHALQAALCYLPPNLSDAVAVNIPRGSRFGIARRTLTLPTRRTNAPDG